jgi:alkanesulfonate monooxygenase SsuD/methylene tetrahydromethanopterin reductase-like flavin-dependent oxidoreductase (luciferase family)
MKFGLWYDLRNPVGAGRRLPDLYRDTLDHIVLAEQLGYDDIWLSEHHFTDDGYLPSLLPFAAAIAARTTRVTIGTNIILMPFHHPIRLAEDCAVVDNLSDGRFLFGPAVGYRVEEFAAYGVERRHRGSITEEAVEIMIKCWTEDEFSYHGRHFDFDNIRCTPKPVQQPHIPIWFGAMKGAAMHRAARLGTGLLGGGPARYAAYIAALKEVGKDHEHPRIAAGSRWFFCSENPKQDWERLKPHALYQLRNYASWFKKGGQPVFGEPPKDYADLEARNLYFVGSPEEIVHNIRQQYAEAPFERHFCWAMWPGVDVATATRSMKLFAEKVIPDLRDLGEPMGSA